ncbi:TonB-dependent receptor [Lentisphaera marina]|uniref:TonB-dependent receptor n=1 Tax=Lentisphaera marina TaxID=1111041 RepID=UPI0023658EC1|nr:TonB-dependent receptor [Lentisphaera marina]MDD7986109.1 TonB-dependent receptor [Lentisphaera marina]
MNYKHYFISLFLGGALFAQDANLSDSQKPSNKEEISEKETPNEIKSSQESLPNETHFITASRNERAPETLAANVTIIGPEKIAQSNARNVAELVKYEAGVDVKKKLNTPSSYRIDVRGFGEVASANTLVLVDGRKINMPDLSGMNLDTIPLNRVEKVEVYRGGRSVLYGDNATGGVINIITRKESKKANTLTLNAEVGSYEYYRLGASLEGFAEDLQYAIDSSYTESDGYHDNSAYRTKTVGFSVLSTEFENLELAISGGKSESHFDIPGPRNGQRDSASYDGYYGDLKEEYLTITPKWWITNDVDIELQMNYREAEFDYTYPAAWGPSPDTYTSKDLSLSPKLTIREKWNGINNTFIVGLDHRYSKMEDFGPDKIRRSTGAYIYNTSAFLDETLFLDLGYRREAVRMNLNNGNNYDTNDLDAFSAGLTYNYAPNSKIFASYDRSFRTQRVDEGGGLAFDEALDPQISKTWQTGIQHQFNEKWAGDLTLFHIESDNEIFYDTTLPGIIFSGQNTSYGETTRVGFELGSSYLLTENLSLYANYTYMDAELGKDSSSNNANDGNTIPGVAEQFANFGFSWDFIESWNLNMNAHWNDDQYAESDYANSSDKQDSFITVDARVTYTWNWLSVYGGINNLFDEEYNEFTSATSEYTAPDRNFVTGFVITHEF